MQKYLNDHTWVCVGPGRRQAEVCAVRLGANRSVTAGSPWGGVLFPIRSALKHGARGGRPGNIQQLHRVPQERPDILPAPREHRGAGPQARRAPEEGHIRRETRGWATDFDRPRVPGLVRLGYWEKAANSLDSSGVSRCDLEGRSWNVQCSFSLAPFCYLIICLANNKWATAAMPSDHWKHGCPGLLDRCRGWICRTIHSLRKNRVISERLNNLHVSGVEPLVCCVLSI